MSPIGRGCPDVPLVRTRQWMASRSCSPSSGRSASGPPASPACETASTGAARCELGFARPGRQSRVQRLGDRPQLHQRVQEDHVVGPHRQLQGYRRAAPDAVSGEPAGGRRRLGLELLIGEAAARRRSAPHGRGRSGRAGPASCRGASPGIIPYVPMPHKDAPSRGRALRADRVAAGGGSSRTSATSGPRGSARSPSTGRSPERLSPADDRGAARCIRPRPGRPRGGDDHLHRGGDEAFCSGGDQRIRGDDGYIGDDEVAQQGVGRLDVGDLHVQIRRTPKPVVAMVAG